MSLCNPTVRWHELFLLLAAAIWLYYPIAFDRGHAACMQFNKNNYQHIAFLAKLSRVLSILY